MTAHVESPGSLLGLGGGAAPPPLRAVHVVMPGGVADPATPSGGNTYDRRICRELPGIGWDVHEHTIAGDWPQAGPAARAELARLLAELPDGGIVLLDGLVACAVPYLVVPEAERLRLAVLVHLPLGEETGLAPGRAADLDALERKTLNAVPTVVATSGWAARRLVAHHGLAPGRVHVAAPGADVAPQASGTDEGTRLLCVASVTPRKGQLRLVEALAEVTDVPWTLECVGALEQDPGYVERLRELIGTSGLGDRVRLTGPRGGAELEASYAGADLLVLASYAETYGMVVTEALAHGVPVLATAVGGVPEALGYAPEGSVPGLLVPPDDPAALGAALRRWLGDPDVRRRLITAARGRRTALDGWRTTATDLAGALERLRREPRRAA
ncbi:glycosyltransferase family 4 protein [Streptomyces sp. NPDC019937]|uniref:glycosyltransferase family 4 protein n=1 Tax=Streptomyces sp. NPDC019937 TaxID=3154787 RepID=UPI0033FFE1F3